jgi:hypothetical protein
VANVTGETTWMDLHEHVGGLKSKASEPFMKESRDDPTAAMTSASEPLMLVLLVFKPISFQPTNQNQFHHQKELLNPTQKSCSGLHRVYESQSIFRLQMIGSSNRFRHLRHLSQKSCCCYFSVSSC